MIENTRYAHALLSKLIPLDPIDEMIMETDEEMSLISQSGRVLAHTLSEFVNDVIPNYGYNHVTRR